MKLREVHVRWMGIPVVALIADSANPDHLADQPFWYTYFIAVCFTAVYWTGATLIINYFRKKYPEISLTTKRLLLTALSYGCQ